MTNIYMLLLMSASGTIMYILSRIFAKTMKHYLWQYAMLITAVVMLLVPIQKILEIPKLVRVTVPQNVSIGTVNAVQTAAPVRAENIIMAIWLTVAVILAARIVFKYIKSSLTLRQITDECYQSNILDTYFKVCDKLSVHRIIMLRTSKQLNSPLIFGLFRPVIIIPDKDFSESELEMILKHELTHYKHGDLWISLAASLAVCAHWFNPAVYFMGKSITDVREMFCDETVLKGLNSADKKAYGRLILSVIEKELNSRLAYTTSMAAAGDSIQKRLRKIVEFKMPTKASTVAGIMAVFACVVSSLTAFGFETVTEVIPEEIKQIIPISAPTEKPLEEIVHSDESSQIQEIQNTSALTETISDNSGYYEDTELTEETEVQYDSYDNAEPSEVPTEAPRQEINERDIVDVTKGSVGFNASFSGKGQSVESVHTFTSDTDAIMAVSSNVGSISIIDADTNEVVYDGSSAEERTARIPVKQGQRLNVSVTSTDDGESMASVYAYGYTETE